MLLHYFGSTPPFEKAIQEFRSTCFFHPSFICRDLTKWDLTLLCIQKGSHFLTFDKVRENESCKMSHAKLCLEERAGDPQLQCRILLHIFRKIQT